jgi:hypothetical protein
MRLTHEEQIQIEELLNEVVGDEVTVEQDGDYGLIADIALIVKRLKEERAEVRRLREQVIELTAERDDLRGEIAKTEANFEDYAEETKHTGQRADPSIETTDAELNELGVRIKKARDEVKRLAREYGRNWRTSIPVQADRDSDTVLMAALSDANGLLLYVEQLRVQTIPQIALRWEAEKNRADNAEVAVERGRRVADSLRRQASGDVCDESRIRLKVAASALYHAFDGAGQPADGGGE